MRRRSIALRRAFDLTAKLFSAFAALVGLFFLGWILYEVFKRGADAIDLALFTELPSPPGMEGGGLANAIIGSLLIAALAVVIGVPFGVMAGVYLSELGRGNRFGDAVRFAVNILMGVPSIIIGLFVYTLLVVPMKNFSGYAGALSLAIIMLPVVARTTEDILNLVPNNLRESALALGAPKWKVTLDIVFRAAKSGLITGIMLAIARISGETAPLLLTALNSPYWVESLREPTANLTVTIFNYAMSPYSDWQKTAWGASLLIAAAVLATTIFARIALMERKKK
ncbi:MAG: phosphate ABC transporter permease PstA [Myxococcota bacterium]